MKNIINRSIAFVLGLTSFLFPLSVSALSSEPFAPDGGAVNINMSDDSFLTYKVRLENFMASYSLDVDDYYYFYANSGSNYTWIFPKDSTTIAYAYDGSVSVPVLYSDTWARSTLDRPISWETNNYNSFWTALKYQNGVYDMTNVYDSSGVPTIAFPSGVSPYCFISYINPPYDPTPSTVLSIGIDEDGFYNWLLATSKDSNFSPYLPLRRLFQYLQFYDAWGSSPQKFLMLYNIDYGDTMGSHLSNTQIIELKNLTDRLYREYLDSLKYPAADFPSRDRVDIRKDIDTNTTDNNTVLITDDSDDTVIVSILRDILRGVIAMKNQIYVTGTDIISGLDNIDFTVNLANNGGDLVSNTDLSVLWRYDSDSFDDDLNAFALGVEDVQDIPQGYIDTINQNALMPENMLSDKNSLTVNVPCITGFTIGSNGSTYSTQTGTYTLSSSQYPWLDPIVQKIKRFGSIILIIGYLVHLRYRIPELVRGE